MIKFLDEPDCPAINNYQRLTKPLIEKRRRARINLCLTQLKEMVIDSGRHHIPSPKCKYEKADILELTVEYLHTMHTKQQLERDVSKQSFNAGFLECLKQVEHFMKCLPLSGNLNIDNHCSDRNEILSQKLLTHLDFCRLEMTNSDNNNITDSDSDCQRADPPMDNMNISLNDIKSDVFLDQNILNNNAFKVIQHTRDYSSSISSTSSNASTRTVSPPLSPEPKHRSNTLPQDLMSEFQDLRSNSMENVRNGYDLGADGVWRPW